MIFKNNKVEVAIILIFIALMISCLVYTFCYMPGITNYDVHLGFQFGFIDFFIISRSRILVGIIGCFLLLVFSGYWVMHSVKHQYFTLGPIYLTLFFAFLIFLNGYHNVVYRFDGIKIFCIFILIDLLFGTIWSFCSSYLQLKKKYND